MKNYNTVLLKLSGEALMGDLPYGQDYLTMERIAMDIKEVVANHIKVCIVVGGGNIYRGIQGANLGIERVTADQMGMLGTLINALALQNILEKIGVHTRVQSAIPMMSISEPFIRRKAIRHMEKGRVVIFAAGAGNPFFTTDTAAVLRALEMNCDVLFKATKVDGVYNQDPYKTTNATKYSSITYSDVIEKKLSVMDMSAIALAQENKLPLYVFSIKEPGGFSKVLNQQGSYTKIYE